MKHGRQKVEKVSKNSKKAKQEMDFFFEHSTFATCYTNRSIKMKIVVKKHVQTNEGKITIGNQNSKTKYIFLKLKTKKIQVLLPLRTHKRTQKLFLQIKRRKKRPLSQCKIRQNLNPEKNFELKKNEISINRVGKTTSNIKKSNIE